MAEWLATIIPPLVVIVGILILVRSPQKLAEADMNQRMSSIQVLATCTYVDWEEKWDDERGEWYYVYYPTYVYEYQGQNYNYHGDATRRYVTQGDMIELNVTPNAPHKADATIDYAEWGAEFKVIAWILIIGGGIFTFFFTVPLVLGDINDRHSKPYMGMGGNQMGMGMMPYDNNQNNNQNRNNNNNNSGGFGGGFGGMGGM